MFSLNRSISNVNIQTQFSIFPKDARHFYIDSKHTIINLFIKLLQNKHFVYMAQFLTVSY